MLPPWYNPWLKVSLTYPWDASAWAEVRQHVEKVGELRATPMNVADNEGLHAVYPTTELRIVDCGLA